MRSSPAPQERACQNGRAVAKPYWDGDQFTPLERPADRRELEERLEGLEIVKFVERGVHPTGGYQFGLEFSDRVRLLVTAVRDEQAHARFNARIKLDFIEPLVWRPTSRRLRRQRALDDLPPGQRFDSLARGLLGNMLVGIRTFPAPHKYGGERQLWEFRDGALLGLGAVRVDPPRLLRPDKPLLTADFLFDFQPPAPKPTIVVPGSPN
mgnify:FL=1